jgi:cyclic pyranopterin phosphate synthase
MSFSEIQRVVQVASSLGIEDYRLTGGEPLMRSNLADLIDMMVSTPKVRDVALTTNGMLLAKLLPDLADAGLRRINISLDTLSEDTFKILSRRVGLNRVLEGIEAALSDPRIVVRLNALVLRDINLKQVVELVRFATSRGVTIRFIEFMPLDADRTWNRGSVVTGKELRELLCSEIGAMQPCDRSNQAQPAIDYHFMDGSRVGFIDTVSEPFCGGCDRLRLTADGKLKNCLFGREEWDVLGILRTDALRDITTIDSRLADLLRDCCIAKARAHGINTSDFELSDRAMYQIGG